MADFDHKMADFDQEFLGSIHAYLGEFQDVSRNFHIFEDEEELEIYMIWLPGVLVFPGESIPINTLQTEEKRRLEKNGIFGVLCPPDHTHEVRKLIGCIGVLLEVKYSQNADSENNSLIGIGRRRVTVLAIEPVSSNKFNAKVKILPEYILDLPLWLSPRFNIKRERKCNESLVIQKDGRIMKQSSEKYSAISLRNTTRCSSPSYWPSWVWQMYNIRALQEHACNLLLRIIKFQESSIPQDPLSFSFWLARNIPLDYDSRQKLLQTSNVYHRLREEISHLESMKEIYCGICGNPIAATEDLFSISNEGYSASYVNAHGFVHQTMTIRRIYSDSVEYSSEPTLEHSWFPGYAWTIINCSLCGSHLGWRFEHSTRLSRQETRTQRALNQLIPFPTFSTNQLQNSAEGFRERARFDQTPCQAEEKNENHTETDTVHSLASPSSSNRLLGVFWGITRNFVSNSPIETEDGDRDSEILQFMHMLRRIQRQ